MAQKYCMGCGARNELDAVFCKKCAKSFSPEAAKPTAKAPVRQRPLPSAALAEEDEEQEEQLPVRARKKRGGGNSPIIMPDAVAIRPNRPASRAVARVQDDDTDDVDDISTDRSQGEEIDADYVPDVSKLEIEPIRPLAPIQRVSWGQLVEEAARQKAIQGTT